MIKLLIVVLLLWAGCDAQMTRRVQRASRILSRHKRYLMFPAGSNFVMTGSLIKAIMLQAPRGTMMLGEIDVPFSLPSDTRIFKTRGRPHQRERRQIFNQVSEVLDGFGLKGDACVGRMVCESEGYISSMDESLSKDIFSALFSDIDHEYASYCNATGTLPDCDVSLWRYVDGLMLSEE